MFLYISYKQLAGISHVCYTLGKKNLSAEGIIPKQGDDEDFSDIHMVQLILWAELKARYPCVGALVHQLAVLDDSETHHVVGHDGIYDAEVGPFGAIKIRAEVTDSGVQVASGISVDILADEDIFMIVGWVHPGGKSTGVNLKTDL